MKKKAVVVRQNATLTHPDGKEERIVLETTLDLISRVKRRIVRRRKTPKEKTS